MRQVPAQTGHSALAPTALSAKADGTTFLIIGDGRLARHLQAYFRFEALHYLTWSRKQSREQSPEQSGKQSTESAPALNSETLKSLCDQATHILLAISDSAIEPFIDRHPFLRAKICVHFSGALVTPLAASAHPLMTFTGETYTHKRYLEIPFVLERGRGTLQRLLPGLKNPSFEIDPAQKVRYHALCVMSGNFTTLLWEKTFAEFAKLGLPKDVLVPYLNQITENLETSPVGTSVLTGPLARGDQKTIEGHLRELGPDAYADVYRSFVKAFESSRRPHPEGEL